MAERSKLWKDTVDREFVVDLAEKISQVYPDFKAKRYVTAVLSDSFLKRELKDRLSSIAFHLKPFLPDEYVRATKVLIKTAPLTSEFANWALTGYVEQFGQNHFEQSLKALKELTKYGTAEFAIRPFVLAEPERMIEQFKIWAKDKNHHVRRLAAEGSRPRGVWVAHIFQYKAQPESVIEILDLLSADESLYVRKAVANNLNDISRDNRSVALATSKKWLKRPSTPHTQWIVKHALRTLLKEGDPAALKLQGFSSQVKLELVSLTLKPKRIKIGGKLEFVLSLSSNDKVAHALMIDYRVTYVRKNGRSSSKVFKLAKKRIEPGESLKISSTHSFKDLSTRTHYPGPHRIEFLINGQRLESASFSLTK